MEFDEVAILLNCHALEDFPVFHRGRDADSLLACWTALWHPCLIARCRKLPTWYRADELPAHDRPRLFVLPTTEPNPEADVDRDITSAGGLLIRHAASRQDILREALPSNPDSSRNDDDLAADFMALGYAYLQTELLTHQMRYSTRVAESGFSENLVDAADAAMTGDRSKAHTLLQSCFDLLSQERNHYYAVDVYLVDLSLVADSILGEPLRSQLAAPVKSNLLLEARLLQRIRDEAPETWTDLRKAVDEAQVGLVGGEYEEVPLSLVASDTIRRQLDIGLEEFERQLGRRPAVFGRRRFGLGPVLPQLLVRNDYIGALHATFDGGQFPEATQAKSRWEGDGQFSIDAISRAPLDATESATFLNLATSLSESMDMDHIASRCFVHWAGNVSPWYRELQRVTQFTHSLGRFVTIDQFFEETYDPGVHDRFTADQYHSPWLDQQAATHDTRPITRCIDYWQRYVRLQDGLNCCALWVLVEDGAESRRQYERAVAAINAFSRDPFAENNGPSAADVNQLRYDAAAGLERSVSGQPKATSRERSTACTIVNSAAFPRRFALTPSPVMPHEEPPIYAAEQTNDGAQVIVDVPAMGLSRVRPGNPTSAAKKSLPPLVDDNFLRNEFLEARIDARTGGLVALQDYHHRSNRLSQQLALRTPGEAGCAPTAVYTSMTCEGLEIERADSICGRISSRGHLTRGDGQALANFRQTFTLWRGSRVIEIQIELETDEAFDGDPWDHYLASRFAWSNEAADLVRGVNDVRRTTTAKRFEAPLFVQIDEGDLSTTILTAGLPFHRRTGRRMLDTILITGKEQARRFRIGLGVDLKQPFRDAMALLDPEPLMLKPSIGDSPSIDDGPPSAWLFHLDARHVMCNSWQPVWKDDRIAGVRVGMIETEGRSGRATLQSFRPFASARKIDRHGQTVESCEVTGSKLTLNVSAHEFAEIEALFA